MFHSVARETNLVLGRLIFAVLSYTQLDTRTQSMTLSTSDQLVPEAATYTTTTKTTYEQQCC
jgi:hypothetical protein